MPPDSQNRWETFISHVEDGKNWLQAYRLTYPEIPKAKCPNRLHVLRFRNQKFAAWLKKRGTKFGQESKMPKNEVLDALIEIAKFNIADLYEVDEAGEIRLRPDFLDTAKKKNCINKITIKRRKTRDPKSEVESEIEVIEILPYSRYSALSRLCRMLGYDEADRTISQYKTVQQNNVVLVSQIDQIRKAIKENVLPTGDMPEINEEFLERMTKAQIVDGTDAEKTG